MYLTLAVVAVSIVNASLGLFALLRSARLRVNRSFAAFAFVTSAWMIANYVGANFKDHEYASYFVGIDFFLGAWIAYSFWSFTRQLTAQMESRAKRFWQRMDRVLLVLAALASLGTFSQAIVSTHLDINRHVVIDYGVLFNVYGLVLIGTVVFGLINLFLTLRKAQGRLRTQIVTMLFGLVIFTVLLATPNLIIPLLTDSKTINLYSGNLAYLGIISFVAMAFYAIVKHRLFDIRLAIVRTIGFIVTIGLVVGFYSLIIVGLGARFIFGDKVAVADYSTGLLLLIPPTIFIGLTFHRLQDYIAKATRRIFYQDLFDLREVIDAFSDTLVTTNDIDKIMERSLRVISDAIKPAHAYFVIFDDSGRVYRKIAQSAKAPTSMSELVGDIKSINSNPVVREELPVARIPRSFVTDDIFLALRLGIKDRPIGMMLFGPKQNGRAYISQDIDLLRIGAKNLAIALQNSKQYEQISHFADTMHKEVLKATVELRAANTELQTLDTMKDDFISMASHQLRTPATSVHEALQMLNHSTMPLSKEERAKLIELAEASSEHMMTVVTDMLSISRIQAGHFAINKSSLVLQELIERVMKQTAVLAEQKKISLKFEKPKEPVHIEADMAKLNEIVSNYIENAIKYSDEKTSITIRLTTEPKRVVFEVSDMGMGVPESERKNLFSKFYRAANARKQQPDGNGIGLFVVKSIAEAHGGGAYYKPQSKGSLFGIWLPYTIPGLKS